MTYQADWQAAKNGFFKSKLTGLDVPPEIVMTLSQGNDLGPSLKKFDAAKTHEQKMAAMPAILKAKIAYEKELKKAILSAGTPKGKTALTTLQTGLHFIFKGVEEDAQPPRPSGKMVSAYTIRKFDLAAGIKTEYLKLEPLTIEVDIEVDETFKKLLDKGEAGFRVQILGDAANAELADIKTRFKDTILKVDATIKEDTTQLSKKTKEANEVLEYYRKLVEDRINLVVESEWKRYLGRRKDKNDFKVKTRMKVVFGTVGVAVAVASVALSFGTAWMNILAAVKGLAEVAKAIKTASETIEKTYQKLIDDMAHIDELNQKRAKGGGQKASKALQVGKEMLAGAMPLTKDMLKATSAIDARCVQFSGQIYSMEKEANKISGKLEIITKNLQGIPNRFLTTEQINLERRTSKTVTKLFEELADLHRRAQAATAFAERSRAAIDKLKKEDTWTAGITATSAGWGSKGVALFALANFIHECAKQGKSLIPL